MADTTFTDGVTLTAADWFNDVNRLHYTIFSDPANATAATAALVSSTTLTTTVVGADSVAFYSSAVSTGRRATLANLVAGLSATQTQQEAGTVSSAIVTPSVQQYHPSAIKAWCMFSGATAGTNAPIAGYNVSTVAKLGTGDYTVRFQTPFSSTNYACSFASDNGGVDYPVFQIATPTVSTLPVNVAQRNNGVAMDPSIVTVMVIGDQ